MTSFAPLNLSGDTITDNQGGTIAVVPYAEDMAEPAAYARLFAASPALLRHTKNILAALRDLQPCMTMVSGTLDQELDDLNATLAQIEGASDV